MNTKLRTIVAVMSAALGAAGCGGGGNTSVAGALDNTAPAVSYVTPSNNANDVGTNARLTVTFSEPMNEASLNSSFALIDEASGSTIARQVMEFDRTNNIATFAPQASLMPTHAYRAEVSTAAKDLADNPLALAYAWRFSTGSVADTTAPIVTSHAPGSGATNVATSTAVAMSFSEPMHVGSVSSAFTLTRGGTAVAGRLAYVGQAAVFSPAAALAARTVYTVMLRRTATDLAGNALAADQVWTFTTGPNPDTTPPIVLTVSPAPESTNVPRDVLLTVTFNEPIFPFVYGSIDGLVANVTIDYSTNTVSVQPTMPLGANASYNGSILVRDLAGNAMDPYRWAFSSAP